MNNLVYIRTAKGQAWLSLAEHGHSLSLESRQALLLFNGYTPVRILFGKHPPEYPTEQIVRDLLDEQLIKQVEPLEPQRKWFGPAVVALGASMLLRESSESPSSGGSTASLSPD